jgi:hypothetical protein
MSRSQSYARYAGYSIIAGSAFWAVAVLIQYSFDLYHPGEGFLFAINQAMFFVAICGWLGGALGLFQLHANGGSRFAQITLGAFVLGWALLLISSPIIAITGNEDMPLAAIGGLLTVLFGVLAGVAVSRSPAWSGWRRFSLLIYAALFLIIVMVPVMVTGNAPHVIPEFLWAFFWLPVAYSFLVHQHAPAPSPAAA